MLAFFGHLKLYDDDLYLHVDAGFAVFEQYREQREKKKKNRVVLSHWNVSQCIANFALVVSELNNKKKNATDFYNFSVCVLLFLNVCVVRENNKMSTLQLCFETKSLVCFLFALISCTFLTKLKANGLHSVLSAQSENTSISTDLNGEKRGLLLISNLQQTGLHP